MLYPDSIESKIDFTIIRERLGGLCRSGMGRELVDAMSFSTDFAALSDELSLVREVMCACSDSSLTFPRGEIFDVRESLARIRVEGLYLDENELDGLRKTLRYAVEMTRFLGSLDPMRYPVMRNLMVNGEGLMVNVEDVVARIDRLLDRYGRIADNASPEMSRIRHELRRSQGSVERVLMQILRRAQEQGLVDRDAAPSLREGRLVLPVSPAWKHKIGGIVHDESATGKTVYIEPQEAVEANNRIRELEGEERRERLRLLREITSAITPAFPAIEDSARLLARVDFLLAKNELARQLDAIVPPFRPEPLIDWKDARHPVLYLNFRQQNKTVVPLNLRLTDKRILVISGPNAGGKSVCLKTVALLQYMLQCGLPVPLAESSVMGLFERLMIDIGDEQSIQDDLSTYSSHLRNMKHFLRYADSHTLFLIDEFGTGTEPLIGGAIAESVLRQLNQQGAFGIITTHYTNIKHFAEENDGIINGAMLYDRGQMRPLYQLSIGQAGSSFAIEIARQTGLPEAIIDYAAELIGEEHIDYDRQLQDIARDKRYWENKRQHIRQQEKRLEERTAYYEQQIAAIKTKQREMMAEAQQQAADLLAASNAAIERTIREIKESQADKQRTRAARKHVEDMKQQVSAGKSEKSRVSGVSGKSGDSGNSDKAVLRDFRDLRMLTKNPARYLSDDNAAPRRLQNSSIADELRRRKLAFARELDLRGMRADEALEALIAYMDDAVMVGASEVTILHGTGTGALKQIVRDYLSDKARQMRRRGTGDITFHDGDPDHGGAGLTIVEL